MFEFQIEWNDAFANYPVKEFALTGAHVRILVGDENLSRHYDFFEGESFDYLSLPVYPIAEWFLVNWWYLQAESSVQGDRDFGYRHYLNHATAAFALPEIGFFPEGDEVLVKWNKYRHEFARADYSESGKIRIPIGDFVREVSRLLDEVAKKLALGELQDSHFCHDWELLKNLEAEERKYCLATAAMGLDGDEISESKAREIIQASKFLPQNTLLPFFEVIQGLPIKKTAEKIHETIALAKEVEYDFDQLQQWKRQLSQFKPKSSTPWEKGYKYARKLRSIIGDDWSKETQLQDCFELAGIPANQPNLDLNGASSRIEGMVAYGKNGTPVFSLPERNADSPYFESSRKFAFGRELYEFLFGNAAEPALITSGMNAQQKANRAFSAELWVPRERLARELKGRKSLFESDIEGLAGEFGVSTRVIRHQIENHELAYIRS